MEHRTTWRLRRIAGACLAVLILCGCTDPVPTQPASQSIATVPITEPTATRPTEPPPPETVPPITEPPLDQEPTTLDPVTVLSSTKWITFPQLLSMGDGLVTASRSYYDRHAGKFVTYMEILDVYNDTVLHELTLDGTRELVCQRFDDGMILTADPAAMEFSVYDGDLELQERFSAPSVDGYFSYDRQDYYYLQSGVLYRMEVASGNRGRVELEQELRLESLTGIHPTEELVIARMYLSPYSDNCGLAVIDVTTGKLRLVSDTLTHLWATGDTFYGIATNPQIYGNDLYIGTFSGTDVRRIPTDQIGTDQMGYSVLPGSHLLVRRYAPDDEPRNTTLFDLKNGTVADLDSYGYIDCTFGATWLWEEQLILGFYEDGDYFIPTVIDPKALTFTEGPTAEPTEFPELVDQAVIDRCWATPDLPDALAELRSRADALEEAHRITIQLGPQTERLCPDAEQENDPQRIEAALTQLETALSLYPEDFFDTFRNSAKEGGLCFCLTGHSDAAGSAKLHRDTYALGLDITADGLDATIHHEIWHAIEMYLSTDTFDTEQWEDCNPSGFRYHGSYDSSYLELTKWTWSEGSGVDSHFLRPYSRIDAREDRATLWEAVMTTDAATLMEAKAIQSKLQIMHEALSAVFPIQNAPWAKYL